MGIAARRTQRTLGHLFQGTSIGPLGNRISEMFGGDGNGSWINTPLPSNTALHVDSATAVSDIVNNIRSFATGTSTASWPTLNYSSYTATINVIDSSKISLQPVLVSGSNANASWAFRTAAMMYAGFPLPKGLQPTNDSDGTIHLYDPDWKWIGRPGDTQYWGRVWELWGARSPEQNAAAGLAPVWTAKIGGRLTGVNQRLSAHPIDRQASADALSQANPRYGAAKAPNDTSANTFYWGYGPDGVLEVPTWMASASHIPMSHHILRMSDIASGAIKHPLGFALFPMYPLSEGSKGSVWPATGYDAASRNWLKHGNRLRLPAGYVATYPSGMPTSWRPLFDLFVNCFRDYGIMLVDTTGTSFSFRAEPGVQAYYPSGFSGKTFLQYLPWEDMQMIVVGNDGNFYPPS